MATAKKSSEQSPLANLDVHKITASRVVSGQYIWIKDFALTVALGIPGDHRLTLSTLKKQRDWLWKHAHDTSANISLEDVAMYAGLYTMVIENIAAALKWPADSPTTHQFHRKLAEIESFVTTQFAAHNIQHFGDSARPLGSWNGASFATDEAFFAINQELHKKYNMILTRC